MAMQAAEIERMIRDALPDARVEIRDLAGDGDHYAATVTSEAFRGLTLALILATGAGAALSALLSLL